MSLHDKLQADAYQWAHNRFPQIQGHLFAARSEVIRYPGETEKQFLARLGHLKSIGHRKGILDLHLDLPVHKGKPGAPWEFDAKVGRDYLKGEQVERIGMMERCGGGGWSFYSFEEFKSKFERLMYSQFGEDLVIVEAKPKALFTDGQFEAQKKVLDAWKKEMRKNM